MRIPIALALVCLGCGESALRPGPERDRFRDHADQALVALADRFGSVELEPRLAELRPRLTTAFFVPSRAFRDETVWTGSGPGVRHLDLAGSRQGDRYRLALAPRPGAPRRPGDYRGRLALERLGDHEYEWRWHDELALGAGSPDAFALALQAILASAELGDPDPRGRLLASMPRTAASLGRLVTLDSLVTAPLGDGSTELSLEVTIHPEGVSDEFPAYARYLDQYAEPVEMRLLARESESGSWWELRLRQLRFSLRARVHRGALAPLAGEPAGMPERLGLDVDLSTRSGLFRVGFERLEAELRLLRTEDEKAFRAIWRRDPEWRIPLLFEPFLKGALNRSFEGEGAWIEVSLSRQPEASATTLSSQFHLVVREAWIIRRLGGLVTGAVSAFREKVEAEADRFHGQVLRAVRDDVHELLDPEPEPGIEWGARPATRGAHPDASLRTAR
jgi:hypothetical protein